MTLLLDRYELGTQLGAGGMGRVVTAFDRRLERPVAVKLIREELLEEPGTRERLLREARSAARMHHPNTVAVFDVGEADGRPFVVMELIEGRSLDDRLRTEGRLEPSDAATVVAAVLDGLAAAHARGLVHRDVKPSNVLLPEDGGVKLADFGIAADLGSSTSLTGSGQVVGSPRYLAPERVDGEPATAASDIYAAGIVLYELLAGRVPFAADNPVATAVAHQQQQVPPLTDLVPDVPAGLASVAERALAKDPAQRFAAATSMRSALLEACRDEGVDVGGIATETTPTLSTYDPAPGKPTAATGEVSADLDDEILGDVTTGDADLTADNTDPTADDADTQGHTPAAADPADAFIAGQPVHILGEVPAAGEPLAAKQPLTAPTAGERVGETTMALTDDGAEHATTVPDGTPPPSGRRTLPRWFAPVAIAMLLLTAAVLAFGGGNDEVEPTGMDDLADDADVGEDSPDADGVADDDRSGEADGGADGANDDPDDDPDVDGRGTGDVLDTDAAQRELDELIAELARDGDDAGSHAEPLLDDLRELRTEDGDDRREEARDLMVEVGGRHHRGQLESDVARRAAAVLEVIGRPDLEELGAVNGLFANVAADAPAWGNRARHLLDDLADLLDEDDPDDLAEDAQDLIDEIDGWVDQDRLEPDRAGDAQDILRSLLDTA